MIISDYTEASLIKSARRLTVPRPSILLEGWAALPVPRPGSARPLSRSTEHTKAARSRTSIFLEVQFRPAFLMASQDLPTICGAGALRQPTQLGLGRRRRDALAPTVSQGKAEPRCPPRGQGQSPVQLPAARPQLCEGTRPLSRGGVAQPGAPAFPAAATAGAGD